MEEHQVFSIVQKLRVMNNTDMLGKSARTAVLGLVFFTTALKVSPCLSQTPRYEGWHEALGFHSEIMHFRVLNNKVVELRGISTPCGMAERERGPSASTNGTVVAREFRDDQITITGFVIEKSDGERQHINIDWMPIGDLPNADRGWILQGLQILLRPGNRVNIKTQLCGITGAVQDADDIQFASGDFNPPIGR
jgi:hypothetical protein